MGGLDFWLSDIALAATLKVSAHAVMEGDMRQAAQSLNSSSTLQEVVEWINSSVAEGRLKLSVKE